MVSEELLEKVRRARPSVVVMGLGGAGCNIASWIFEAGVAGGRVVAANTDVKNLSVQKADKLILLGEKSCGGHGCGGFPERGAAAARESLPEIKEELEGVSLLFLVAGLGGGTGTGAVPVVAELAREMGILTICCVTIPFSMEFTRREKAREAVRLLVEGGDAVVVIDNSRLLEVAGELPLRDALAVANSLVGSFVKNLTDAITQPGLVNLDYADLQVVMDQGGIASIGIGEGAGENRIEKAVEDAVSTPLLDIQELGESSGVLIQIIGGEDLTLDEVTTIGEKITEKVPTKKVVWGARIEENLAGRVRVIAVITGVSSSILKPGTKETLHPISKLASEVLEGKVEVEDRTETGSDNSEVTVFGREIDKEDLKPVY